MDEWIAVSLLAVAVFVLLRAVDRLSGDREKIEEIRKKLEEARAGRAVDERTVVWATSEMNKILVRRMVISLGLLLPLWWVYHLGEIETPLGEMGALWWYIGTLLVLNGGVLVGRTLQKAAKEGGR